MTTKRGLGKGLDALFTVPATTPVKGTELRYIAVADIRASKQQPRQQFDDAALQELAQSIKIHGIIQPIILRKQDDGYEVIVGERRLRAAKLANLESVPALIRNFDDLQSLQIGLIENLQREDLNPIEEAIACKTLLEMGNFTHEALADILGIDRATLTNKLRLLSLASDVKQALIDGSISSGHAKALLAVSPPELQVQICQEVMDKQLSVRETEQLIQHTIQRQPKKHKQTAADPHLVALQESLTKQFETRVHIVPGKRIGKIIIEYYSNEDLSRLLDKFAGNV